MNSSPVRKDPFLLNCVLFSSALLLLSYSSSLFAREYWVFDLFRHFMAQYFIGSLILSPFWFWKKKYILSGLIFVVGCASFVEIVSRIHVSSPPSVLEKAPIIKLAHYNRNVGNTGQSDLISWVETENPDIFVIQEAGDSASQAAQFLRDTYPHQIHEPRPNAFGQVLASKYPISDFDIVHTPYHALENFYIHAVITLPGETALSFYAIHPPPPISRSMSLQRNSDLNSVSNAIVNDNHQNILLCGDWNITAYSPYFSDLLEETGLNNMYSSAIPFPTWPHQYAYQIFQIPIDHVLFKGRLSLLERKRSPAFGSDHYPVIASFALQD